MTGWTPSALRIAAEQYAGNKTHRCLFKTRAVPPPWSDDLQHGVDASVWYDELSGLPDETLLFVIENEPEPALLVQTIGSLRNSIDHETRPSRQFPDGGVFWLRTAFKCLLGTPTVPVQPQEVSQLELFR